MLFAGYLPSCSCPSFLICCQGVFLKIISLRTPSSTFSLLAFCPKDCIYFPLCHLPLSLAGCTFPYLVWSIFFALLDVRLFPNLVWSDFRYACCTYHMCSIWFCTSYIFLALFSAIFPMPELRKSCIACRALACRPIMM